MSLKSQCKFNDWDAILNIADTILNSSDKGNDEARYRSSINRAYYAAFRKAREVVRLEEYNPVREPCPNNQKKKCFQKRGVHQCVPKALQDKRQHDVAEDLIELRKLRTDADYHNNKFIGLDTAKRALIISRDILKAL